MEKRKQLPCNYCSSKTWKWEERYCCMCGYLLPRGEQVAAKRSLSYAIACLVLIWMIIAALVYVVYDTTSSDKAEKAGSTAVYATERPEGFPFIIKD